MAHVAEWKYKEVEQLTNLLSENKIIGIADIGRIPAPQLQHMRKNLGKVARIRSANLNFPVKSKSLEQWHLQKVGKQQLTT